MPNISTYMFRTTDHVTALPSQELPEGSLTSLCASTARPVTCASALGGERQREHDWRLRRWLHFSHPCTGHRSVALAGFPAVSDLP